MSVVHIVDEALNRPHTCAQCGESRGPFLDTVVDLIEGRLYLCMMCLRLDAAEAGFAEGHRMDELVDAKGTVEHAEHEVDARNRQIRELKQALAGRDQSVVEMQAIIEQLEGEIKRKDHLTRLAADNALAAVAAPGTAEPVLSAIGIATAPPGANPSDYGIYERRLPSVITSISYSGDDHGSQDQDQNRGETETEGEGEGEGEA